MGWRLSSYILWKDEYKQERNKGWSKILEDVQLGMLDSQGGYKLSSIEAYCLELDHDILEDSTFVSCQLGSFFDVAILIPYM